MSLKVLHLSTYDSGGGAARAAYALHKAMVESGIASNFMVARKSGNDPSVTSGSDFKFRVANRLDRQLWRLQRGPDIGWRSPARFGSTSADLINRSNFDVVNLHWVTGGFLSIEEIGKIKKPLVWTLHDMWPFAGTEHYASESSNSRWRVGYSTANRPNYEYGFDIDRMTWERKAKHWKRPIFLIPVSSWLGELAAESALMNLWPNQVIPNIMDTVQFTPVPKAEARQLLGLPVEKPLVSFVSAAGIGDKRKGWALLEAAMGEVQARHQSAAVIVVGPSRQRDYIVRGFPIYWLGEVTENERMRQIIGAADVAVIPSTADNLPLTALEAHSCGRPVVAFRLGGLSDIVTHRETGYLAAPADTGDLARGLIEALDDSAGPDSWGPAARTKAELLWSADAILSQYLEVYRKAMG